MIKYFGNTEDGNEVLQVSLRNGDISCDILTYGGIVRTLTVPDKNGRPTDVVLGHDTMEQYLAHDGYLGALVGRYANRIGKARFNIYGKTCQLFTNDGENSLHGGEYGFDRKVWDIISYTDSSLVLGIVSPDGEEGYPGNLSVEVCYDLFDSGLCITYSAITDKPTVCNLTNHPYFNLGGHSSGNILSHKISLNADLFTPADAASIPTGDILSVENTPMDLRRPCNIGARIDEDYDQLSFAGGYDHNWIVNGCPGTLRRIADVSCEETGISMSAYTTAPGVQFYTGNFLGNGPLGKDGAFYGKRAGFCLEAQNFPDSPNKQSFPSPVLLPGDEYYQRTEYRFTVVK